MAIINYMGTYNFENIFELTKDEMIELKDYIGINNESEYITRLLGMYCHSDEKLFDILEQNIDKRIIKEMKKCNNFIMICPEIIKEFCIKYFDRFNVCNIRDIFELYTIIFNQVIVHENGHGVFNYTSDWSHDEIRANFFVTLTFDGTFDIIIKNKTEIQGGLYKNPWLITDEIDISKISERIYNI